MPVPAAAPSATVVLMSTIAGSTAATTDCVPPPGFPVAGAVGAAAGGYVGVGVVVVGASCGVDVGAGVVVVGAGSDVGVVVAGAVDTRWSATLGELPDVASTAPVAIATAAATTVTAAATPQRRRRCGGSGPRPGTGGVAGGGHGGAPPDQADPVDQGGVVGGAVGGVVGGPPGDELGGPALPEDGPNVDMGGSLDDPHPSFGCCVRERLTDVESWV